MFKNPEPKILAIDTSTDVCSVAISDSGSISESTVIAAREHTHRILPMVESILSDANIALTELDAIAVANGPGSFTGLRIGLSIAQGLAYGADLPLVPISTLAAMANAVIRSGDVRQNQMIVPAIDARMNEVYWAAYQVDTAKTLMHSVGESVSPPFECYQYCDSIVVDDVIAVGSGWRYLVGDSIVDGKTIDTPLVENPLITKKQRLIQADIAFHSTAYDILELALVAMEAGDVVDPMDAQPRYLRNEITWKKRQRIRS